MQWHKVKKEKWGRGCPIPVPPVEGVYLLVNVGGEVVYIGSSSKLHQRYKYHSCYHPLWDGEWFVYSACAYAETAESLLLPVYAPRGNTRHPPVHQRRVRKVRTHEERSAAAIVANRNRTDR